MKHEIHDNLISDLYLFLAFNSFVLRNMIYGTYKHENKKHCCFLDKYKNTDMAYKTCFKTKGEIDVMQAIDNRINIYEVKTAPKSIKHGKAQLKRARKYLNSMPEYSNYDIRLYLCYFDIDKNQKFIMVDE